MFLLVWHESPYAYFRMFRHVFNCKQEIYLYAIVIAYELSFLIFEQTDFVTREAVNCFMAPWIF